MSTTTDVIAGRLAQLRSEHDMTQQEMSEFLQLSRGRYANWEVGFRSPKLDEIAMVADRLGVSPAWIVGWSDDRQNSVAVSGRYITAARHTIATNAGSARVDNAASDTAYSIDYLNRRGLKDPQCLSIRNTGDDAMPGIFAQGDEALIDRSQQTPTGTDLYAILIDNQAVVRWIERHPDGSATVKAERGDPWQTPDIGNIRIIGRVARIAHDR